MLATITTKLDVPDRLEGRVGCNGFGKLNPRGIPEVVLVKAAKAIAGKEMIDDAHVSILRISSNRHEAESNHYSALCLLASQPNWTYLISWSVELVAMALASSTPAACPSLFLPSLQKAKAGEKMIDEHTSAFFGWVTIGKRQRANH